MLRFQVFLVWTAVVVKVSQMNLVFGEPLEIEQDGEASDMNSRVPTSMAINVPNFDFHDFDMDYVQLLAFQIPSLEDLGGVCFFT